MKSTGIVRRIDDLGRIVIPKEIRRTLRIREGDPLEILTDNSGNIVFKKYSLIKEISPFAVKYADVLHKNIKMPVLISDCDHIISACGVPKREFLERRITSFVEELMKTRSHYIINENSKEKFFPVEGLDNVAFCIYPIISSGDVEGSICVLNVKNNNLTEQQKKFKASIVEITCELLSKHLED